MKKGQLIFLILALTIKSSETFCQTPKVIKHENVIYGMISGLALLMDVYQPEKGNKIGIIFIEGSGFGYFDVSGDYNQVSLKDDYSDTSYGGKWAQALVSRGYTVFFINHRFAPRFHFPDIFYDCQRAVRFIRFNAKEYGIDPNHIGAMGHSSGANLSAMLGVTDTVIAKPENPIDSVSSKVQAVITLSAHFNLADMNKNSDTAMIRDLVLRAVLNYIGELPREDNNEFILSGKYAQASPITYGTKDDAAFLIYYSDNDPIVPARQAPIMCQKLKDNGVPVKLILKHDEGHEPKPNMDEADKWFKQYLK